jgi:hypothetical protein
MFVTVGIRYMQMFTRLRLCHDYDKYVCMYVECIYVFMYLCIYLCIYVYIYVNMYILMYAFSRISSRERFLTQARRTFLRQSITAYLCQLNFERSNKISGSFSFDPRIARRRHV